MSTSLELRPLTVHLPASLLNCAPTLRGGEGRDSMSLGIAFKGPEGIVLAADSRVTLMAELAQPGLPNPLLLPATYDSARKLLQVQGQKHVGAVTYGAGAIGAASPRTAHSYIPEFEQGIAGADRFTTEEFAQQLGAFFLTKWNAGGMPNPTPPGAEMIFLVGGYDDGEVYGKVYEIKVPNSMTPVEQQAGSFGIAWGGQTGPTERLLNGYDSALPALVQQHLGLDDTQRDALLLHLKTTLGLRIPYPFLPLQDCVDLAIFMIRTTIKLQTWLVDVRGVGGYIDLATITRDGIDIIQQKKISGE